MINYNFFNSFEYREVISALEDRRDKVNDLIECFERDNSFTRNDDIIKGYRIELKIINDTLYKIRNSHYF